MTQRWSLRKASKARQRRLMGTTTATTTTPAPEAAAAVRTHQPPSPSSPRRAHRGHGAVITSPPPTMQYHSNVKNRHVRNGTIPPLGETTDDDDGEKKTRVPFTSPTSTTTTRSVVPGVSPEPRVLSSHGTTAADESLRQKRKSKKSSPKKNDDQAGSKTKKKNKKSSKRRDKDKKEEAVVVLDGSFTASKAGRSTGKAPVLDDTSVSDTTVSISNRRRRPSPSQPTTSSKHRHKSKKSKKFSKKDLSPAHKDFYERVSFAFDLCRRQTHLTRDNKNDDDDDDEDDCFLPLVGLTLDKTNLHSMKRLAKKNADLPLTKLHLYQVRLTQHGDMETLLDIFVKRFTGIARLVLSAERLQMSDLEAIARRFTHLAELRLYGGGSSSLDLNEWFSPAWDDTLCRLAGSVARHLTLPHMGGRLPTGICRGLSQSTCIVRELHLKLDDEGDVERLVRALCRGRSVRRLRLESAACRTTWLGELLMQYDPLEQLELYHCQNTHEKDDDRLAAWMI